MHFRVGYLSLNSLKNFSPFDAFTLVRDVTQLPDVPRDQHAAQTPDTAEHAGPTPRSARKTSVDGAHAQGGGKTIVGSLLMGWSGKRRLGPI